MTALIIALLVVAWAITLIWWRNDNERLRGERDEFADLLNEEIAEHRGTRRMWDDAERRWELAWARAQRMLLILNHIPKPWPLPLYCQWCGEDNPYAYEIRDTGAYPGQSNKRSFECRVGHHILMINGTEKHMATSASERRRRFHL